MNPAALSNRFFPSVRDHLTDGDFRGFASFAGLFSKKKKKKKTALETDIEETRTSIRTTKKTQAEAARDAREKQFNSTVLYVGAGLVGLIALSVVIMKKSGKKSK